MPITSKGLLFRPGGIVGQAKFSQHGNKKIEEKAMVIILSIPAEISL